MTEYPPKGQALSQQFRAGFKIGFFTIRAKIPTPVKPGMSQHLKRRWRVECGCGQRLTVYEWYLIRPSNPKTHCGCQLKTAKTHYNQEYRIWCMIHQRCLFPEHDAYKHYGGRGIKIHPTWLSPHYGGDADDKGFERFLAHIGPRPSMKFSVDRIDVNKGYEPGNVRWATAKEQAANKRPRKPKHNSVYTIPEAMRNSQLIGVDANKPFVASPSDPEAPMVQPKKAIT